jgi:putative transposase
MGNHYHLLVKTPEANLGRAMRHINGLYTQRYNRLKNTDGSLFRCRYKAICVEEDSYQLQLSRYIHRNPVVAKLVKLLDEYSWSSYSCYVKNQKVPQWLYPKEIFEQLQVKWNFRVKYRQFVEQGIDK